MSRRQVPRLPHKSDVDATTPEPAQCRKCHACHTKQRGATQQSAPPASPVPPCDQVPSLPHKIAAAPQRPRAKCYACHTMSSSAILLATKRDDTKWTSMPPTATLAHNWCPYHQAPRLPHKTAQRPSNQVSHQPSAISERLFLYFTFFAVYFTLFVLDFFKMKPGYGPYSSKFLVQEI